MTAMEMNQSGSSDDLQPVTSPHTAADRWTKGSCRRHFVLYWTLLLQKSDTFCCVKKRQKPYAHWLWQHSLSQAESSHVQVWTFPTSLPFVLFLLTCNQSPALPSVRSSLMLLSSGECGPRVWRVKAGVQFHLSEADPLLLMPLRGLRDTEVLFFQRTEKTKRRRVSYASLAGADEKWTLEFKC